MNKTRIDFRAGTVHVMHCMTFNTQKQYPLSPTGEEKYTFQTLDIFTDHMMPVAKTLFRTATVAANLAINNGEKVNKYRVASERRQPNNRAQSVQTLHKLMLHLTH
jgi:hypothetical protein